MQMIPFAIYSSCHHILGFIWILSDLGGIRRFCFQGCLHGKNVSLRIVEVEPCCWTAVELDGVYAIPMILPLVPLVVQKKERFDDTLDLPAPRAPGCNGHQEK